MNKNRIVFLIMIFIMALSLTAGCSGQSGAKPQSATLPADVLPVQTNIGGIIAEARVVPAQSVVLTFPSPGLVDEVMVAEGDTVQAGQVLARLNGAERAAASVASAELAVLSAEKALKNLQESWEIAKSNAELALAEAKIFLEDEQDNRKNKNFRRVGSNYLDEIQANYILAKRAVEDAEDVFENVVDRSEDDPDRAAALVLLARARINRDRALENLNYALGLPDENEVAKADARVALAQARLEDAQRTYDRLKDGPDPDNQQLAEARLVESQKLLVSAQAVLTDLELKAPFAGVVVTNSFKVGEFANPGTATILLADLADMQVETTDLTELDVVNIKVGQTAVINIDALPGLELSGKVERIKNLGENRQGDIVYTVVIKLAEQDARLKWNMNGTATFNVE